MATVESRTLTTADGHELAADLALPDGPPVGGAVVCHPHPQFGGDRFNPVVDLTFRALADRGFAAMRFDFRAAFADGIGERQDVISALDALAELDALADRPLVVAGYSFGAAVSLNTADSRIAAIAAIAPPLTHMQVAPPERPVLVLSPRHDQFSDPDAIAPIVETWPDVALEPVESADHFLAGHFAVVAERSADWLVERVGT